ncbi:MAG: DUF1254 domain-containing protein [Halioglobus sp.]
MLRQIKIASLLLGLMAGAQVLAEESPYTFTRGFPANPETIKKAQDATDLRRAIEAYKFFYPTVATEAVIQQFKPHGAIPNKVGIIMPQDPEQQFSVANQDTPYIIAVLDFKKSGPMVIDIPPGPYIGLLCDHDMSPVADLGTIGAGKGKGEKNLILPPGYDGEIPEGYYAYQSDTWEAVLAVRVMSKTGSYEESVDLAQKVKVYPLSEAGKPSSFTLVDVNGQKAPLPMLSWETSIDYWRELHAVVNRETVQMRHRVMLGMLASVGIKKGEEFKPTERQTAILTEAAKIGYAEMRILTFANPRPEKIVWEGRNWEWMPLSGPINAKLKEFGNENYRDLSASDHFFFQAWGTTAAAGVRKVGAGSIYFSTFKDSTSTYLDGGKNYKLTIPGPVPAKLFWSVTVYDSETRTIIDTDQGRGAVRMLFEKPTANADDSFDVYFGPDAPKGKENQWVKTIPGKGWFTYVRMYGPEGSLFDGTYKLPDIEKLD